MKIFRTLVMVLAVVASFPAAARFDVQVINYTDVPATGAGDIHSHYRWGHNLKEAIRASLVKD